MVFFRSLREDIFLILAIIVSVALSIVGLMGSVNPFELSQFIIVIVFLAIAVTLAERVSKNQKVTEVRLNTVETGLRGLKVLPPPPQVGPALPSTSIASSTRTVAVTVTSPQSRSTVPQIGETLAACSIEFLADESRKASFIESIMNASAVRNEGYRFYITAENAVDKQGTTPNGLPLREEACLGPVNAGRVGLMRVFLDPAQEQKGKRENVAKWLITLRNKIGPNFRNVLLRQVVVKEFPFVPMLMCVPTFDAPVHVVLALAQPVKGASTTVHLTMRKSVFQKSFLSDWIRFVQMYPDYEYSQQEEQKLVEQRLDPSATEFSRVDSRAARVLAERMTSVLEEARSTLSQTTDASQEDRANRLMKDEYLKNEWNGLIHALTTIRDLLSSSLDFSAK